MTKEKAKYADEDRARDQTLIRMIQSGDEGALSSFYDEKSRLVYSLAYSVVRHHEDAEEVTQEVFYRLWTHADRFNPERGSVLAWLTTITRRLAIDRTRSRQFKSRGRESSLEAVGDTHSSNDDAIDNWVEAGEVLDAMRQLDGTYQDVIRLSYYEGLSHAQIASKLDIPLGTVKSRLREGVTRLRRVLNIGN